MPCGSDVKMLRQSPRSLENDRYVCRSQPEPVAVVRGVPLYRFSVHLEEDRTFRPLYLRNQFLEYGLE